MTIATKKRCKICGVWSVFLPGRSDPHDCKIKPKDYRGIGDIIERLVKLVTRGRVKPCEGCKRRRDRLNRWWRFR